MRYNLKRLLFFLVTATLVATTASVSAEPQELNENGGTYRSGRFLNDFSVLRRDAESGVVHAQVYLATKLYKGDRVSQNYIEAAFWFWKAARHGETFAQFSLGHMSANGQGIPKNYARAAKWYRMAARQGDADAQRALGLLHAYGKGVRLSYVLAYMWFSLAASQGDSDAGHYRDTVTCRMTPGQLSEAQRLAKHWRPE